MSGHERERLSAYIDRELPPGERAAVEAHLAACPECTAFLAELAAVDETAAGLPAEAPAGYFEAFPARVRARLQAPKAAFPARRVPAWTWAAAAALLLAVVTPLTLRQLRPAPGEAPAAAPGALPPAPAEPEGKVVAESRRPETPPTARPARAVSPEKRGPAPAAIPADAAASAALPPPRQAEARVAKDEATAEGFFAREPGAPPPPDPGLAVQATPAEADAAPAVGGVPSEAAANREKGVHLRPRPATAAVTAEAVSPALSAASAGRAAEAADMREREDAFLRLEAVRPRSAAEWRRLREEWSALAATERDPVRADEARVRAIVAAREAWRAGGDGGDEAVFRGEAESYLRREDARQKPRVLGLLAER